MLDSLTCLPHLFAYRAPPVVCPCHPFRIVAVRRGGVCEYHFVVDTCGYTHQDTTHNAANHSIRNLSCYRYDHLATSSYPSTRDCTTCASYTHSSIHKRNKKRECDWCNMHRETHMFVWLSYTGTYSHPTRRCRYDHHNRAYRGLLFT